MDREMKTLVLICRQDFCRLLGRVLHSEGLLNIQHGNLALLAGRTNNLPALDGSEVFVVSAEPERAERLIRLMRACPLRGGADQYFELYTIG